MWPPKLRAEAWLHPDLKYTDTRRGEGCLGLSMVRDIPLITQRETLEGHPQCCESGFC